MPRRFRVRRCVTHITGVDEYRGTEKQYEVNDGVSVKALRKDLIKWCDLKLGFDRPKQR